MSQALLALESFLSLTETISRAVEAQEWDDLERLGEERAQVLATLPDDLEAHLSPTEYPRAQTIMTRCQQLDDETCARVNERQKLLRVLLREPQSVN